MIRAIMCCVGISLLGGVALQSAKPQKPPTPSATAVADYRATLNRYCVTCHNGKLKTAGLTLDKIDIENAPAGAEVWEKVIRKLRGNAMPPPGLPQPPKAFYESF